eukprot:g17772.t1
MPVVPKKRLTNYMAKRRRLMWTIRLQSFVFPDFGLGSLDSTLHRTARCDLAQTLMVSTMNANEWPKKIQLPSGYFAELAHATNAQTRCHGKVGLRPKRMDLQSNPVNEILYVVLWDDRNTRIMAELRFKTPVRSVQLRRDLVVVATSNKVWVYGFKTLSLLHSIETTENPKGLCCLSSGERILLLCPGMQQGSVLATTYPSGFGDPAVVEKERNQILHAHDRRQPTEGNGARRRCGERDRETEELQFGELRRGLDRAEIHSLAFSPSGDFLVASSDKGTVHVFALRTGGGEDATNSKSSLKRLSRVLPVYFSSEWSFAQFRVHDYRNIAAFSAQSPHTVIIVCANGSYYKVRFDPSSGGEMIREEPGKRKRGKLAAAKRGPRDPGAHRARRSRHLRSRVLRVGGTTKSSCAMKSLRSPRARVPILGGLPSKYLEPLAPRLCSPNGRSCYTYDQRGCGLSQGEGSADLGTAVLDLLAVLRFLHCSLGEAELHILAHGFGGALLMEALARHDLFSSPGLPKLRSFCLWSVASSTQLADQAAEELMAASAQSACVAAWRGVEDAGGDFSESVLGGCGHHAHLEAPDTVAATLRLWLLKVEDGPATSSRTPSSTSWTPSSGVKGRWLLREEARQHLTSWASKLCWANALASNATPGAWRSVGQGLPQRDIFAPSRTARRLAVWAADLPERPKSSADAEVMSLSELWKNRPRCSRMALALQDDSFDAAAIVCLERTNGDVTIVGMAQNPSAPHRCRLGDVQPLPEKGKTKTQ